MSDEQEQIQATIQSLEMQLATANKQLEAIKAQERIAEWQRLSQQYGVLLNEGIEFTVTQAIREYAVAHDFDRGAIRVWMVGFKGVIRSYQVLGGQDQLRAVCHTGHFYNIESGGHIFGQQELMSANTPFPIELIVNAIKDGRDE